MITGSRPVRSMAISRPEDFEDSGCGCDDCWDIRPHIGPSRTVVANTPGGAGRDTRLSGVIRPLQQDDIAACASLLARLPAWFGIPEANAAYTDSLEHLPGFVAVDRDQVVGFAAVLTHGSKAAEISVMGVDPDRHRQGL